MLRLLLSLVVRRLGITHFMLEGFCVFFCAWLAENTTDRSLCSHNFLRYVFGCCATELDVAHNMPQYSGSMNKAVRALVLVQVCYQQIIPVFFVQYH